MYFQKGRRARPEQQIQRAVFQHLHSRAAPGIFAFHVPNGGYRKPIEAAILKGLGVRAGVPDIIAIHNGRCYALELKAEGGRATDKQLATIAAMERAGAFTAIAEGLDAALRCLEAWGLLSGKSQIGAERQCSCGAPLDTLGRDICFACFCHQQGCCT